MIFKYGSYAHDQDECLVRVTASPILDNYQRRMGSVFEYTIVGVKRVADNANPEVTKANLTTALQAMEAAYNVDFQNFGLYLNDGVTATAHTVLNSATFGGVKVIQPPSYIEGPWGGQIEYLNRRTYQIRLRAEIRTGTGIHTYRETLTVKGTGGPLWRFSPREVGDAQKQVLQTATTFFYIQEGEAIGRTAYPSAPAPLFPLAEHERERVRTYGTPQELTTQGAEMYPTTWRYVMEATTSQPFGSLPLP